MQKQLGKIGLVRREVCGKACPFCGCHKYQLVLRPSCASENSDVFARCSQCHRPRSFDDNFVNVLWM
jgi:hypothetical protein